MAAETYLLGDRLRALLPRTRLAALGLVRTASGGRLLSTGAAFSWLACLWEARAAAFLGCWPGRFGGNFHSKFELAILEVGQESR